MNAMEYKGYVGVFEYEPGDDAFHGSVAGIRDVVHFSGRSIEELRASLAEGVEDYLEMCAELGREPQKPYSGKFMVRVGPELHRLAEQAAKAKGQSLNSFVAEALEREAKATVGRVA